MSEKKHFVIWKGIRSGPFTKEELEREFTEGKLGLVRTVLVGATPTPASEFIADIETRRWEEEMEEQVRLHAQQAEDARQELERKEEEYQQKRDETSNRPSGKSLPPPIPEINPWAPQLPRSNSESSIFSQKGSVSTGTSWWDGKGPIAVTIILCLLCFFTGQVIREITGSMALILGAVIITRKRITLGAILIGCALLSYGLGLLLSDLFYEYLSKNYPN